MLGVALSAGAYAQDDKGAPGNSLGANAQNYKGGPFNVTRLFTAPLVPEGKSQLDCYIINVSHKSRRVLIEALDRDGTVVADWTENLAAGKEAVAIAPSTDGPRSCRFTVEGSGDYFRASGLVVLPGTGSISALAAQ
jgi:hypothetical protein